MGRNHAGNPGAQRGAASMIILRYYFALIKKEAAADITPKQ